MPWIWNANIIVTNAKGMGKHFAEAAAKAGAKVFVGDVDENGLAELPDTIGHAHLDVTRPNLASCLKRPPRWVR